MEPSGRVQRVTAQGNKAKTQQSKITFRQIARHRILFPPKNQEANQSYLECLHEFVNAFR